MKPRIILKFKKNDDGITVETNDAKTIDLLMGMAETIQMLMDGTGEKREKIISDINIILDVLEKEKEEKNE